MKTLLLPSSYPQAIHTALEILSSGGLVAFPTDTVYGLGAMVNHPTGIARLYEAKARSVNKAIAVLIGNLGRSKPGGIAPTRVRAGAAKGTPKKTGD